MLDAAARRCQENNQRMQGQGHRHMLVPADLLRILLLRRGLHGQGEDSDEEEASGSEEYEYDEEEDVDEDEEDSGSGELGSSG